jgi:hypothetical protein
MYYPSFKAAFWQVSMISPRDGAPEGGTGRVGRGHRLGVEETVGAEVTPCVMRGDNGEELKRQDCAVLPFRFLGLGQMEIFPASAPPAFFRHSHVPTGSLSEADTRPLEPMGP